MQQHYKDFVLPVWKVMCRKALRDFRRVTSIGVDGMLIPDEILIGECYYK